MTRLGRLEIGANHIGHAIIMIICHSSPTSAAHNDLYRSRISALSNIQGPIPDRDEIEIGQAPIPPLSTHPHLAQASSRTSKTGQVGT